MKKFERLPQSERKEEIQKAALYLFVKQGFSNTTMEDIVNSVSLSKGGVYRIYSSQTMILSDIILKGMRMRNKFYEESVKRCIEQGNKLDLIYIIEMIFDSLLLYPEFSSVYVEFLWEKKRNAELEKLYKQISESSVKETEELIKEYGAEDILCFREDTLEILTELMNCSILSLKVLDSERIFVENKKEICESIRGLLEKKH